MEGIRDLCWAVRIFPGTWIVSQARAAAPQKWQLLLVHYLSTQHITEHCALFTLFLHWTLNTAHYSHYCVVMHIKCTALYNFTMEDCVKCTKNGSIKTSLDLQRQIVDWLAKGAGRCLFWEFCIVQVPFLGGLQSFALCSCLFLEGSHCRVLYHNAGGSSVRPTWWLPPVRFSYVSASNSLSNFFSMILLSSHSSYLIL